MLLVQVRALAVHHCPVGVSWALEWPTGAAVTPATTRPLADLE